MLRRLSRGLSLNPQFLMNQGRLLGHKAVKDYEEKVILEMTTPVNVKGVRSFLGHVITSVL